MLVTEPFGTKPPLSQFALRGLWREGVVFFPSPSRRPYINRWDMCCRNEGKSIYHIKKNPNNWQPKRLKRETQKFPEARVLPPSQYAQLAGLVELVSIWSLLSVFWSLTITSTFLLCYLAQHAGNRALIILLIAQDGSKVKMMESKLH